MVRYQGMLWNKLDLHNCGNAQGKLRGGPRESTILIEKERNEPFQCPSLNCSETFDQAGKFTNHMNLRRRPADPIQEPMQNCSIVLIVQLS